MFRHCRDLRKVCKVLITFHMVVSDFQRHELAAAVATGLYTLGKHTIQVLNLRPAVGVTRNHSGCCAEILLLALSWRLLGRSCLLSSMSTQRAQYFLDLGPLSITKIQRLWILECQTSYVVSLRTHHKVS